MKYTIHIYIVTRHVTHRKIVTTRNVRTTIRTRLHIHIYIHRQTPHTWMSHAWRHPPKKSNDSPAKKRVKEKKSHDSCPCVPQIRTCSATNTTETCSFIPNTRSCSTIPRVDKLLERVLSHWILKQIPSYLLLNILIVSTALASPNPIPASNSSH